MSEKLQNSLINHDKTSEPEKEPATTIIMKVIEFIRTEYLYLKEKTKEEIITTKILKKGEAMFAFVPPPALHSSKYYFVIDLGNNSSENVFIDEQTFKQMSVGELVNLHCEVGQQTGKIYKTEVKI